MCHNKILGIVGPTASGKTDAALALARLFNGEVVSCDSVQVFKHLDIGSAKPGAGELKGVPYHLIDIFEPVVRADVGEYKKLAERKIIEILDKGRVPIVAGGTGMYFNSLYYGLFAGPGRDNGIRERLLERAGVSPRALYDELLVYDPASAARIPPNDLRRIVRALEVYYRTGKPISELHRDNKKLELDWFIAGLDLERKSLYEKIEKRIDQMMGEGLVEETRVIIERYGKEAYALSSIGYRHAVNYISGLWTLDETVCYLKRDTRRYAKRQLTWFKKNRDIHWFEASDFAPIRCSVEKFLSQQEVKR